VTQRPESLDILRHLASKPGDHDAIKADFRALLVAEFDASLAEIRFEQRVEVKSRIDALIGRTVFEAKRDLASEMKDVERKMPDYLANREAETGEPFVGIASDGRKWVVMALDQGALVTIKETILDPERPGEFLAWLDGALALKISLPPDPETVRIELGADSVAFRAADAALRALWARLKADRAVMLKRQLWAQLLKIVYGREVESDALWLQHTYLVIVAKCIALAALGLNEDDPARLLSGDALTSAGITGAVESDFFDWAVADAEGVRLVRRVMAHVRRFRLAEVESDVLKVLYESLIDRTERHGLGEYYTPDWLAAKMVKHAVERPLEQRVLDPACGSGTFLFHAIRRFLAEAEAGDVAPRRRAFEATQHVAGMDIHPVAVIIARVTYLLALAPALAGRAGAIYVPVYLGDAMQLSISEMIGGRELTIRVPPPAAGEGQGVAAGGNGKDQLEFPDTFCRDPGLFDKAIERMRSGSEQGMNREQIEKALYRITEQHYRADVTREQQLAIQDLGKTYVTFDKLRRDGRDSVWAYVARNLSRPLAFSAGGGWANVVVGNPPWVAFRHMSADLQTRFKELANGLGVYVSRVPSQNDLSALFTARAATLYLRASGRLAFLLPLAALTRGQFERLRTGAFHGGAIQWDEAWTMDDSVQPLFPVPSCAVFGRRRATSKPMPDRVRAFSGPLPLRDAREELVDDLIKRGLFFDRADSPKPNEAQSSGGSPYRKAFRNGATLFPRMLCFVERRKLGRLGGDLAAPQVISRRSNQEKAPWKALPSIENRVEAQFLRPVLLGESVAPYRVFMPFECVMPVDEAGAILDAAMALDRGFDQLAMWMRKAEAAWESNRSSDRYRLTELFDYFGQLTAQFPLAPLRVIYAASGTQPAAAVLKDSGAVIEHKLYWCAPASLGEASYLAAILNSETARERTAKYQSRGQWGARDFDKVVFNLPIPRYDAKIKLHRDLADAAAKAERVAAAIALPEGVKFQRARSLVRAALKEAGLADAIDALVATLLDGA
jgi:hypothetical protein